jgi:N-acylneuraminate cytidylyltransferase
MSNQILALVPARGGSKGIPRKNIMSIGGKPLIAHTILQAKAIPVINRVIVSTDDPEIAETSRAWGAEVPFQRPVEFADDHSPDIDVFRHALSWLAEHEGYRPDLVVHLRPTCPMRRLDIIERAIALLAADPTADAVRAVSLAVQTPYKMWRISEDGYLVPLLRLDGVADSQSLPRQHLPEVYWQNGYVDVIRPRAVLEKNSMWGTRAIPLMVDEHVFELDIPEDIPAIEEALRKGSGSQAPAFQAPAAKRYSV